MFGIPALLAIALIYGLTIFTNVADNLTESKDSYTSVAERFEMVTHQDSSMPSVMLTTKETPGLVMPYQTRLINRIGLYILYGLSIIGMLAKWRNKFILMTIGLTAFIAIDLGIIFIAWIVILFINTGLFDEDN